MSSKLTATATHHENTIAAAFVLPAAVREMWRFVSTDETRTHLRMVELQATATELIAVATDGHRLIKVMIAGKFDVIGRAYVPGAFLKSLKPRKDEDIRLGQSGETVTASTADWQQSTNVRVDEFQFPHWEQVIPGSRETHAGVFGFDAKYVGDFADYLKKAGLKTHIRFEAGADDMSPMTMSVSDDTVSVTYILMPVRL